MEPLPPTWILPLIALPLFAAWLVGLLLSWPRGRAATGEVVLQGEPEALSRRLAERLAASGGGLPPLRILDRTPDLVVAVRPSTLPSPFERLEVRLAAEGSAVRFRWTLHDPRLGRLQLVVALLSGLGWGGLFVLGVPLVVGIFVLPSDEPAIRWQVVQTVQMIHGIWPPYMVAVAFWIVRSVARRAVEIRIANLPHGS